MKQSTIRTRLLEAAIQFGRNEAALRDERRLKREMQCTLAKPSSLDSYDRVECFMRGDDNGAFTELDWCENCRIKMTLRNNPLYSRRLRQLAKERIVRLVRRLEA